MQRSILVFVLTIAFCTVSYFWIDVPVVHWTLGTPAALRNFFDTITELGHSRKFIIAGAVTFLFFRFAVKRKRGQAIGALLFLGITVPGALLNGLKISVGRYRPHEMLQKGLEGFSPFTPSYDTASFPSGHSCTVFAIATAATIVDRRLGFVAYPLATILSFSRMALQRHYLSDVVFGAMMGLGFTILMASLVRRWGLEPAAMASVAAAEPQHLDGTEPPRRSIRRALRWWSRPARRSRAGDGL